MIKLREIDYNAVQEFSGDFLEGKLYLFLISGFCNVIHQNYVKFGEGISFPHVFQGLFESNGRFEVSQDFKGREHEFLAICVFQEERRKFLDLLGGEVNKFCAKRNCLGGNFKERTQEEAQGRRGVKKQSLKGHFPDFLQGGRSSNDAEEKGDRNFRGEGDELSDGFQGNFFRFSEQEKEVLKGEGRAF
ncbi:MAG: hypothetical protein QXH03_00420 [Candidatus Bathyarchaeia archaeon]